MNDLKSVLKLKIQSSNNEFFFTGDKVFFKEEDKVDWSGPATVVGNDGKIIFLKYGNNLRRVHCTKIVKEGSEFGFEDDNSPQKHSKENEVDEVDDTSENSSDQEEKETYENNDKDIPYTNEIHHEEANVDQNNLRGEEEEYSSKCKSHLGMPDLKGLFNGLKICGEVLQ